MSWFTRSIKEAKSQASRYAQRGGGGGSFRRVWMPVGVEREFLFLDDPIMFWEHEFGFGKEKDHAVCTFRAKMSSKEDCRGCNDEKAKTYYVGLHTCFSLTPWGDKRIFAFERQIFAAKWGSARKPATLQRLQNKAQRYGGTMVGLRIASKRLGDMSDSVGDDIDVVEKVGANLAEIEAWLMPKIKKHFEKHGHDKYTLEGHLKYNPIKCFDFEAMMDPSGGDGDEPPPPNDGDAPARDDYFYSGSDFSDEDTPF